MTYFCLLSLNTVYGVSPMTHSTEAWPVYLAKHRPMLALALRSWNKWLYHSLSWYTLVTLMYTTPDYGIQIQIQIQIKSYSALSYVGGRECITLSYSTWASNASWLQKDRFDSCNCFPATLQINTNKVKELQTSSQSYRRRPKLPRAARYLVNLSHLC